MIPNLKTQIDYLEKIIDYLEKVVETRRELKDDFRPEILYDDASSESWWDH